MGYLNKANVHGVKYLGKAGPAIFDAKEVWSVRIIFIEYV